MEVEAVRLSANSDKERGVKKQKVHQKRAQRCGVADNPEKVLRIVRTISVERYVYHPSLTREKYGCALYIFLLLGDF